MPPKDPIVIGMRMHESARVYRRFLDFPLKCWRCFHVLDVPNEKAHDAIHSLTHGPSRLIGRIVCVERKLHFWWCVKT